MKLNLCLKCLKWAVTFRMNKAKVRGLPDLGKIRSNLQIDLLCTLLDVSLFPSAR